MLRAMSNLSAEDVKAWYNQHYAAKGLQTMRPHAAYPLFLDLVGAQAGSRLLDVSCGAGSLLAAAGARDVEAVGVDLSDEAVRLAQRVAPAAQVAVGAGEALAFRTGTFDYVTCLGSLEHFLDMGRGLEEMKRVAKPTARFCIMVPNEDFIGWKVLGHQGTAQQDINEHLLAGHAWRQRHALRYGTRHRGRLAPDSVALAVSVCLCAGPRPSGVSWKSNPVASQIKRELFGERRAFAAAGSAVEIEPVDAPTECRLRQGGPAPQPQQSPAASADAITPERCVLRDCAAVIVHELIEFLHDLRDERRALLGTQPLREIGGRANDLGGRAHRETGRRDVARDERVGANHGAIADRRTRHDKNAPRQPHTLAERDRLVIDGIAVQRVEPDAVREDETMAADARVVADHDGIGGIDERELENDRAAAQL